MTHFRGAGVYAVFLLKLYHDVDLVLGGGKNWLRRGNFFLLTPLRPHRDEEQA